MNSTKFHIPNMSCNHCVMRIEKEMGNLDGIEFAKANLSQKTVEIKWDESAVDVEKIKAQFEEIGYPISG